MKTENIEHVNIVSYYSDDNNNLDDIYSIYYPAGLNIEKEINRAYKELSDNDEMTNELSCMLDFLIKDGVAIDYEVLHFKAYNCDYGTFEDKGR